MSTYRLTYKARPWTTNAERQMNRYQRAKKVKEWRDAFLILALEAQIPPLEDVRIIVTPHSRDKRWRADTSACHPAVKASIDGLVDAKVLVDDNPDYLKYIGFNAPIITGEDSLELEITGIKSAESKPSRKLPYKNGRKSRS